MNRTPQGRENTVYENPTYHLSFENNSRKNSQKRLSIERKTLFKPLQPIYLKNLRITSIHHRKDSLQIRKQSTYLKSLQNYPDILVYTVTHWETNIFTGNTASTSLTTWNFC